jgi:hypothetical protein
MNPHIVGFPLARRGVRLFSEVNELEPLQSMALRGVRHAWQAPPVCS